MEFNINVNALVLAGVMQSGTRLIPPPDEARPAPGFPNTLYSADPTFDFVQSVFESLKRTSGLLGSPFSSPFGSPLSSPPTSAPSSPRPISAPLPPSSSNVTANLPNGFDANLASSPFGSPLSSAPSSPCSLAPENAMPSLSKTFETKVKEEPSTSALTPAQKKKARMKKKSHENRKQVRVKTPLRIHKAKPSLTKKHLRITRNIPTAYDSSKMNIATTGYVAPRDKKSSKIHSLEELVDEKGFTLVKWDGKFVTLPPMARRHLTPRRRTAVPISDANGTIIGLLAGQPDEPSWLPNAHQAAELIERTRPILSFKKTDRVHRRGNFPALGIGISHGGGQTHPGILQHDKPNASVLQEMLAQRCMARLAGFASGAFLTWAPRLYHHHASYLDRLIEHGPTLRRNWPNSPWAAVTINFGPQTVCFKHADFGNLAFGWCAVTSLGNFDPSVGGHFVLWNCKLVIEFPPGSTIMIPSCAIHHSNVRIRPNETRYSFTQYTAGGIFRWVDNGFQRMEDRLSTLSMEEIEELMQRLSKQLAEGLALYPTLKELQPVDQQCR